MKELIAREKSLEGRLETHSMTKRDNMKDLKKQFEQKQDAVKELNALKAERKSVQSTLHLEELNNRKRVLRRLGYLGNDDALVLKVISRF